MDGADQVIDFELNGAKAIPVLNEADWIFCLDFNALFRTRHMEGPLAKSNAIRMLIDHHQQPAVEYFAYGIQKEFNL